jgi:hydrogenase maturation protein HypF
MSHDANTQHQRFRIVLEGAVQGFGLRPTVYRVAQRLHLTGWVRTFGAGLEIEVEGGSDQLREFLLDIELKSSSAIGSIKQTILPITSVSSKWFEILPDMVKFQQRHLKSHRNFPD